MERVHRSFSRKTRRKKVIREVSEVYLRQDLGYGLLQGHVLEPSPEEFVRFLDEGKGGSRPHM